MKRTLRPITRRPLAASRLPALSQRHRFVLAGVIGGGGAVGSSLADVMQAIARFDRDCTEREALACLGELTIGGYIEASAVDRTRYVARPKGLQEIAQ